MTIPLMKRPSAFNINLFFCGYFQFLLTFPLIAQIDPSWYEQGGYGKMIKEQNRYYNEGVAALNSKLYYHADSLFTRAIECGDRNKDTYFNRAIARKRLRYQCGFCVDLMLAADRGDQEAYAVFQKYCSALDSISTCEPNVLLKKSDSILTLIYINPENKAERHRIYSGRSGLISTKLFGSSDSNNVFETNDSLYDLVRIQEPALFPGGDAKFFQYVIKQIKYPQNEMENGIQGKVLVTFIIEKDGTISNVAVYRGVKNGPGLGKEVVRVIKSMPNWQPALANGVPVRMRYIFPFHFKLQ